MRFVSTLTLFFSASVALAQGNTCFNGPAAGTLLGNQIDTVYPAQAIGFAFPLGVGAIFSAIVVSWKYVVLLDDNLFCVMTMGRDPLRPGSSNV